MEDLLTRKVKPLKHRQNKKTLSQEIEQAYRLLVSAVLILGIGTTVSYLYINSLAPAKGYQLKQLQIDYENLQSENRDLERSIIEAQSFIELEQNQDIKKMEDGQNDDFTYIDEDSQVAQNE